MNTKLSTLPQGTFAITFKHSFSKAIGYEGHSRLTITALKKKYTAMGGNYSLESEALVEWLNDAVVKAEDVQQRLAEILEKNERFTGSKAIKKTESGAYVVDGDIGLDQIEYLLGSLGLNIENTYSSNRSNRYKTGIFIKNEGY